MNLKGTTFAGIVYCPQHPDSDIHGLLRACVRTTSLMRVGEILASYGVSFRVMWMQDGLWSESKSIAEIEAAQLNYGVLLVCPLWTAYLNPSVYKPMPKELKVRGAA